MKKEILVPTVAFVLAFAITGCQSKLAQSPYGQKEEAWGKVIKENYSDWSPPPTVPPDRADHPVGDMPATVVSGGEETIEIMQESPQPVPQVDTQPKPLAPSPDTVAASPVEGEFQSYTVAPKDTLWGISKRFYGSGKFWKRIYDVNSDVISSPEKLKVGIELKIPSEQ